MNFAGEDAEEEALVARMPRANPPCPARAGEVRAETRGCSAIVQARG